jgi:hypothetical protein
MMRAMSLLIALAAAATSLPTPAQAQDIRCVAVLALVAGQHRGGAGSAADTRLRREGAEYAAIVGDDVMTHTGQTRERVRDEMLNAVRIVRRGAGLDPAQIDQCTRRMQARLAVPVSAK